MHVDQLSVPYKGPTGIGQNRNKEWMAKKGEHISMEMCSWDSVILGSAMSCC